MIDFNELGTYLKKKRELADVSQTELAKKLGYTSPQFVSNWERGLAAPPPEKMKVLVKTLRIPERELIEMLTRLSREFWSSKIKGRTRH